MGTGELFDPNRAPFVDERLSCKAICRHLNGIPLDQTDERAAVMERLFGKPCDAWIEPDFYCDYGYNVEMGKGVYFNHHCVILDTAKVTIGDRVLFGPGVTLSAAAHPLARTQRAAGMEWSRPITIGDDVWLGAGVVVNPGVTIGDNVVIGSGSVVTKDIPSNVVVVGVPAKILKPIETNEDKVMI